MQFDFSRRFHSPTSKELTEKAERLVIRDPRKMFKLIVAHLPELAAGTPISWKPSAQLFNATAALPPIPAAFDDSRTREIEQRGMLPEEAHILEKTQEREQIRVFQMLEELAQRDPSIRKIADEIINIPWIRVDEKMFLGELVKHINRLPDSIMTQNSADAFRLLISPMFHHWRELCSIKEGEAAELLMSHPAAPLLHETVNKLLSAQYTGRERVRARMTAFMICGELISEHVKFSNDRRLQEFGGILDGDHSHALIHLNRIVPSLLDESRLTRALRATSRDLFEGQRNAAVLFKGLSRVALPARSKHSTQGELLMGALVDAAVRNDIDRIAQLAIATVAGDSGTRSPYLARKFPILRLLARELGASAPLIRFNLGLKSEQEMLESLTRWRAKHPGASLRRQLGAEVKAVIALVEAHRSKLYRPLVDAAERTVTIPATLLTSVLGDEAKSAVLTVGPNFEPEVVLVTGASQGIGRAIVERLAARPGCTVIATARESSLHLLHSIRTECDARFIARPLDVTKREERERLVQELRARGLRVTTLINNAGVCGRGPFEQLNADDMIEQLDTNVFGGSELAKLVLQDMKHEKRGKIIVVSSLSGMMGVPTMGSYSASKFALEGLYESLYYEVLGLDIHVTLMQLGFIRSESFLNSRFSSEAIASVQRGDAYGVMINKMNEGITRGMRWAFTTPERVACETENLIDSPKPPLRKVVGLDGHLFTLFRRIAPRALYHEMVYRLLYGRTDWERALREERDRLSARGRAQGHP